MPTLITKKLLNDDADTGYAFVNLKQASGIVPTIMGIDYSRTALRRDGKNKAVIIARQAAAGGSDITQTLYVARTTTGSVTLPDLSNASSFGWQFIGAVHGPLWSDDDNAYRTPDESLFVYRVVAL